MCFYSKSFRFKNVIEWTVFIGTITVMTKAPHTGFIRYTHIMGSEVINVNGFVF